MTIFALWAIWTEMGMLDVLVTKMKENVGDIFIFANKNHHSTNWNSIANSQIGIVKLLFLRYSLYMFMCIVYQNTVGIKSLSTFKNEYWQCP